MKPNICLFGDRSFGYLQETKAYYFTTQVLGGYIQDLKNKKFNYSLWKGY